jgi:hypothetical protein
MFEIRSKACGTVALFIFREYINSITLSGGGAGRGQGRPRGMLQIMPGMPRQQPYAL